MNTRTTILPLRAEEWRILRNLRLGALRDCPEAFAPTWDERAARPDQYWQDCAEAFADDDQCILIAWDAAEPVGMISARRDESSRGHLDAHWVARALRGTGTGAHLFEAACDYLRNLDCLTLLLRVTDSETRARSWYADRGFTETGVIEPLRSGSPLRSLQMSCSAGDSTPR